MSKVKRIFGGGGNPNAAAQAAADQQRRDEEMRQARIRQGQSSIDSAFSSFNDDFYNSRAKDYEDYYRPQVDKQYGDTLENVQYSLARQGIAESNVASKKLGDLLEFYNTQKRGVADRARQTAGALRGDVENQKSSLYGLNTSSADPALAASRANSAVASLSAPQAFSPLGQIFASFINTGANMGAAQNSRTGLPEDDDAPAFNFSQGGSGRLVNQG